VGDDIVFSQGNVSDIAANAEDLGCQLGELGIINFGVGSYICGQASCQVQGGVDLTLKLGPHGCQSLRGF